MPPCVRPFSLRMSQPLLALGALVLLSVLALNQQQGALQLQVAAHGREAERLVLGLATDVLAEATRPGLRFDRAQTDPSDPLALRAAPGTLTPVEAFGEVVAIGDDPRRFTAIEDFVAYPAHHAIPWGDGVLPAVVTVRVRYVTVDPATQEVRESTAPTLTKEVRVTVRETLPPGSRRAPAEVTLSRLVTPALLALH